MNKDILEGKWKEIMGKVKQKWGKLTDDDLSKINGSYEKLEGSLQKAYGYRKDEVKKEIEAFAKEEGIE